MRCDSSCKVITFQSTPLSIERSDGQWPNTASRTDFSFNPRPSP